jgi:hypothetical protein
MRQVAGRWWDDLPVHLRDQHQAAEREMGDRFRDSAGELAERGWRSGSFDPDSVLGILLLAMATRVHESCPHVRTGPVLGAATMVHLSLGWAACAACTPAYIARGVVDDGRCDICSEPAPGNRFTEHAFKAATVVFLANVGECCEDKFPFPGEIR